MKQIQLTQGKVALVDDEDYEYLNQWKWHYSLGYAVRTFSDKKTIWMHRLILNTPDNLQTDHINGNGLDNQKKNLRACNHSENQRNKKRRADNTSGYIGVSWRKQNRKWEAYIRVLGVRKHINYFLVKEDAARAYDESARKHFGIFARLNFPN